MHIREIVKKCGYPIAENEKRKDQSSSSFISISSGDESSVPDG